VGRHAVHPATDRLTRAAACGPTGLTLVELVLGVSITVIIGGAVAAMLFALSEGTSVQTEARSLAVSHVTAAGRIGAAVRTSRNVLAAGEDYLVLWQEEVHPDAVPNLSELQRIERDPATKELWSYRAPVGLPEASDTAYDLETTDFNAVTLSLKGTESFPGKLWATDVGELTISLIPADPQQAAFVSFRIALTADGPNPTAAGGAALRNR
jgi:hypothetical protein